METPPFPEKQARDHIRSVVLSGGLGAVPLVGAGLASFIEAGIAPSYEKRQARWFAVLEEVLHDIEMRLGGLERVTGDEEFMSALAAATRIALGTHLEEKLNLLKAALIRVAEASGRDLRHVQYLYLVDQLEPEHVGALSALNKVQPEMTHTSEGDSVPGPLETNRVVLLGLFDHDDQLAEIVARFLAARDLLEIYTPPLTETPDRPYTRRVIRPTRLGRDFLEYLRVV
jgi:hypothetical protein